MRAVVGGPLRHAAPALVLYYAVQLLSVIVLWLMSAQAGANPVEVLLSWDGGWYLDIAENGYPGTVTTDQHGAPEQNSLAFFPLYPTLIAALSVLGLPLGASALFITALAGGLAAWAIFTLGHDLAGPRAGNVVVVLFASAPGSVVLHMAYAEALFIALAAWSLVAVLRNGWIPAATLACLAGLTRPTALVLFAAIGVAAIIAIARGQKGWQPLAAVAIAPLGMTAYLLTVATRTGRVDGWFWLQEGAWHLHMDWGAHSLDRVTDALLGTPPAWVVLVSVLVIASVMLMAWSVLEKLPWPLLVYAAGILAIALVSHGYWQSTPRFLLPAFVIALPPATLLATLPTRTLATLLAFVTLASSWFGAHLLTVSQVNP